MSLLLLLLYAIVVVSPRCSFHTTSRNTYTSMLVITVALLLDYLWFTCNLLLLRGDVKPNSEPDQNTAKNSLFATRTLIL